MLVLENVLEREKTGSTKLSGEVDELRQEHEDLQSDITDLQQNAKELKDANAESSS